ncbi:MAG: mandelate racemase/muconate lactonizing enzyme family protein [Trueperaceae bacterium]
MNANITDVATVMVKAAKNTNWIFIELQTEHGVTGTGEASLSGSESKIAEVLPDLRAMLMGKNVLDLQPQGLSFPAAHPEALTATVRSAVDQALWDIKSRLLEVPLWQLLGGQGSRAVPLYANINRAALDRSPDAMARLARQAIALGFHGVKCAPLDGLTRRTPVGRAEDKALATALERVQAIRQAIGPQARLMVDCHWHLTPVLARRFVAELEPLQLTWLEDPFPESETEEWLSLQRDTDIPLAGGERATSLDQLARALAVGQYQICCPDVRIIGGVAPLWHAAHLISALGAAFAPHNPRGPIGTLASAHVCAAVPDLLFLEFPFAECSWRSELVSGSEVIDHGNLVLPRKPGVGAQIEEALVEAHPYDRVVPPNQASGIDIW